MSAAPRKKTTSLFTRIVAAMLVFVMVAGLLLYQQTEIILTADGFSNKSVHLAALQLLKNDPYANASRLERMSLFARNLLGGERTYKDYDSAVQIAIAQARYDEALAFNEKALASYDGDEEGAAVLYLRMGYLYAIQEQYEKAQEWLDLGIAVLPLAEAVLTRAQVRLNLNDADGALADVNACLDAVGDSVELLPDLINVVEASGQYERAANLWSRLIDAEGGADYLLHRAHCYFQLGRMADAEADAALYEQAGGTELGQANAMLGMGFMRAGEYDRAGGLLYPSHAERIFRSRIAVLLCGAVRLPDGRLSARQRVRRAADHPRAAGRGDWHGGYRCGKHHRHADGHAASDGFRRAVPDDGRRPYGSGQLQPRGGGADRRDGAKSQRRLHRLSARMLSAGGRRIPAGRGGF